MVAEQDENIDPVLCFYFGFHLAVLQRLFAQVSVSAIRPIRLDMSSADAAGAVRKLLGRQLCL